MPRREDKSFYFQEIAGFFSASRGSARLSFSSRDMVTIRLLGGKSEFRWHVVLEGMERAFERYQKRALRGENVLALLWRARILKAGAEFKAGDRPARKRGVPREKEKRIRAEV